MMSAIAMTLMLVASLSCFAYLMIPRTKVLLNLQPDARFDQVGERIKSVVKFAIGQWRMPREPIAGFAHIMIFSGFMVVALGTILHIAHAYGLHPAGQAPRRAADRAIDRQGARVWRPPRLPRA